MKKTYTHCKLGLFAGLLIFHTLSSCVHTGRALGVGTSRRDLERSYAEQMKSSKKDYIKWIKPGLITIVGGSLVAGGCLLYNHLSASYSEEVPVGSEGNESTALTTVGSQPVSNDNTTMSLAGVVTMAAGAAANRTLQTFVPNGNKPTIPTLQSKSDQNSSMDETSQSATKSYNIKPTIVSQEVMDDIKAHNYSINRIKYWLNKGESINSIDPNGVSLVSYAIDKGNWDLFKFLVDNKVDLNLADNEGYTPMMYIKPGTPNSKRMYRYALEHGADPCTKNKKGQRLDSKPGMEVSPEVFKKCSD